MDNSAASLLCLPSELLLLVLAYVGAEEWRQVRQACRTLSTPAASLLFGRVHFELCGSGCESLCNISQDPVLSRFVKTIVLRRVRGYRKFSDFNAWAESLHQPGAPDVGFNTARETTYYSHEGLRDQLMPYAKWAGIPRKQKEALYQAYNADRKQQQKEVRDITNILCFRGLSTARLKFVHPHRAVATGTANVAVRQLYKALGTLPNLKAFEHEPGFLHDAEWALRWRDLYFHPYSIIDGTTYEDDEDVEALQLSVVLQALACIRGEGRRLQKMSMYVGGPAFATPERMQQLWNGDGHEYTRTYRLLHTSSSAAADAEAFTDLVTPAESELYRRQLELMAHAFADMTCLDCRVSDEDEMAGCIETAAKFVFPFLLTTKSLQSLRLAIGRLVDGILLPTYGHTEREQAQGSMMLLWNLSLHSRWSRIRNIELEIATDRNTLLKFLLAHKDTLRFLTLTRTSLVRLGNHRNTWEPTLTEIGRCLRLESLSLSTLCDTLQDWGPGVHKRMLFDVDDHVWKGRASEYEAYHDRVVARVLHGEVIDSLQPQGAGA
jgi:hypothetical protein